MSLTKKEKKELGKIAYEITHAHSLIIKFFWYIIGFYYGGSLRGVYQKWFCEKIKWTPKNLTIVNSFIFGFGGAILYFSSVEGASIFISKYFLSWVSNLFHITFRSLLGTYVVYNMLQNFFRIIYAERKNRGIASFNMFGLGANIIHFLALTFHKKVLKSISRS